jgi:phosphoheptose isomerase
MILLAEILSIWAGLSALAAAVVIPPLSRRFRAQRKALAEHEAWLATRNMPQ